MICYHPVMKFIKKTRRTTMKQRDLDAYRKFLTAAGIEEHLIRKLTHRQLDAVDEALKSLPEAGLSFHRPPFDIIRLSYGFHGKRFAYKTIGEIYNVSAMTISTQIKKIIMKSKEGRIKIIKAIFYPATIPLRDLPFKERVSQSIDVLELPTRTKNCLRFTGIKTIGNLINHSENELLKIQYFGRKHLNLLKETLNEIKLCLGMSEKYCSERIAEDEQQT